MTLPSHCFGGVLSLLYGSIFNDGPMNLICFYNADRFPREMKLFQNFDKRYFDVDRPVDSIGNVPPEMIWSCVRDAAPASRAVSQGALRENI